MDHVHDLEDAEVTPEWLQKRREEALKITALRPVYDALVELVETDQWAAFSKQVAQRTEKLMREMVDEMIAGKDLNQREVDWMRGHIDALKWVSGMPALFQSKYEIQAKKAARYLGEPNAGGE